jgi:opacity protein-like surface antigen
VRGFTIGGTYMVLAGQSSVDPTEIFPVNSPAAAAANRQSFNRVFVYGGDVTTNILGFNVEGSYTQTNTGGETLNVDGTINTETEDKTEDDNFAYDVAASREFGSLFIKGGYRFVGAFFGAPGAWARVGSFQNPVDIKGPYGTVGLKLGRNLSIMADGQFYEGTGDRADEGGLTGDDKITNYRGTLNWKWSSMSSIMLGAELTEYRSQNFFNGNKPRELFYNVGYGYNFSPNAGFKLGYQFIDYDDKETGFDPTVARGGVATAQFSVKF